MIYDAVGIAYHVLNYSKNELNQGMSNLKLQKVLYFIQAEFLVKKDEPCFEESIEAWDFGPVIPMVYQEFKMFGSNSILLKKEQVYYKNCTKKYISNMYIKPEDEELIKGIVDECSKLSSTELVEITQNQTPWMQVYDPCFRWLKYKPTISNESIKEFFSNTENY